MFYSRKYIYRYLRTNNLRELVVGNFTISFGYSYHYHLQIKYNGHLIAERFNVSIVKQLNLFQNYLSSIN